MNAAPTPGLFRAIAAKICAFSPVGTLALYVLLAFYSRVSVGHWPRYYEYQTVYNSPTFRLLGVAFLLWGALSLLLAPILWGVLIWHPQARLQAVRQVVVYITAWLLFILIAAADPGGFTSFLVD